MKTTLEPWRYVWREMARLFPLDGLESLRRALLRGDRRLINAATTSPAPVQCVLDWPCEGCDPIGWVAWREGSGDKTVAEVEEYFARVCFEADQQIGEPAACRHWLRWWDETPLEESRPLLLAEVQREIARRTDPT